jgi:hypothetical protein
MSGDHIDGTVARAPIARAPSANHGSLHGKP